MAAKGSVAALRATLRCAATGEDEARPAWLSVPVGWSEHGSHWHLTKSWSQHASSLCGRLGWGNWHGLANLQRFDPFGPDGMLHYDIVMTTDQTQRERDTIVRELAHRHCCTLCLKVLTGTLPPSFREGTHA